MTFDRLLADLSRRGVHIRAVGNDVEVEGPSTALTPALRAALMRHKPGLLATLRQRDVDRPAQGSALQDSSPPASAIRRAKELAAFAWLCAQQGAESPALEAARSVLEGETVEERGAAVECLAAARADFRLLRDEALNSLRPATPQELAEARDQRAAVVGVAGACLICGGTEYWLPAVDGLVYCKTCHPERPMPRHVKKNRSPRKLKTSAVKDKEPHTGKLL